MTATRWREVGDLAVRRPWHLSAATAAAGLALAPAGTPAVLSVAALAVVVLCALRAAALGALCGALVLAGSALGTARLAATM